MSHSVLVVEDEPNIVISLRFIMEQAGFSVRVAEDGQQAVDEIAREAPDVVLLDLMLPEIDGFSVCETMRANPDLAGTKIVVLSAKSREIDRDRAMRLGADDFVTKPFSTRDLGDRVRRVLGLEVGAG
jgi:DNA-binding response OmpR family regulator